MRQLGLKNDIVIIPNGVDPPGPSGGSRAQSAIRAEKAKGRKVLLYLGRIHPKKGLINLLKAWKRASAQLVTPGREWALAICGWEQGGHEAELKRVATELGIPWAGAGQDGALRGRTAAASAPAAGDSRSLLFPGPQFNEAKAACYADCDGFILPSFSEGVPMVVLEAWAYGKPVLVTPQCNLPEGYAAGAALRIEPEPESIAQGLAQFWSMTDSERQAMGQRAMALVAEKFVWRQIAAQTRQLYEWMLGGGPKPNGLAYF